jgi:hypothetical protein
VVNINRSVNVRCPFRVDFWARKKYFLESGGRHDEAENTDLAASQAFTPALTVHPPSIVIVSPVM